jgi:hypothetical protein
MIHRSSFEEEKIGLPDVALKCAESVGINWPTSGVGECAGLDGSGKGTEGVLLLRESVKHSIKLNITWVLQLESLGQATESNLRKSCTIVISGKKVCVHDEVWKECEVRPVVIPKWKIDLKIIRAGTKLMTS